MTPIGVGVAVWQGADFVAETLASILAQRDVRLQVFVSIDGADRRSENACRPFLSDPRVDMVVQPHRLGWVANTAAALAGAAARGAEFACIFPHDDLAEEHYFAALLEAARENPGAAVVFGDIVTFGTLEIALTQPSVTGSPLDRQLMLLREHYNAVAYRGLTRAASLARIPPLSGNDHGDFACDTVWMARLARIGDLIRVPQARYRKRMHDANTHGRWMEWSPQRKIDAWLRHCLDMLAEAVTVTSDPGERNRLVAAARSRLLLDAFPIGPYQTEITRLGVTDRAALCARFDAMAASRGLS
jgi:hypothetical protein